LVVQQQRKPVNQRTERIVDIWAPRVSLKREASAQGRISLS
jgi:hypothetical protein